MNSYKCAENIIAGAGGYENITFIRHAGPVIIIGIRNNRIIQNGLIERNDMVRRCRLITDPVSLPPDRKCGELQVAMKPGDAAGIYNELCTLREYYELRDREEGVPRHNLEEDCKYLEKAGKIFADPDEDCGFTETCGDDGTDECDGERRPVQKGKYTAEYFMNAAKNILTGAGGYENIISFCHDGSEIKIKIKDEKKIEHSILKKNDMIKQIASLHSNVSYAEDTEWRTTALLLTLEPENTVSVYNDLCTLYKDGGVCIDPDKEIAGSDSDSILSGKDDDGDVCGTPSESSDTHGTPPERKYTAGYFINVAEKAAEDLLLLHVDKNALMGFVFMIAEEAARFANEKGLDDEFTLVPEFVKAITDAKEKDGRMEISGNVFISADKSACISVQYQKNGNREAYNILVTEIEDKNRVSYAGEINGPTDREPLPDTDGGRPEKRRSVAGTESSSKTFSASSLILIAFIIVIALVFVIEIKRGGGISAEDHRSENEIVQQEVPVQEEKSTVEKDVPGEMEETTQEDIEFEPARKALFSIMSIIIIGMRAIGTMMIISGVIRYANASCSGDGKRKQIAAIVLATGMTTLLITPFLSITQGYLGVSPVG